MTTIFKNEVMGCPPKFILLHLTFCNCKSFMTQKSGNVSAANRYIHLLTPRGETMCVLNILKAESYNHCLSNTFPLSKKQILAALMGFSLKYGKPEGFVLIEDTVFHLKKSLSCHEMSQSISLPYELIMMLEKHVLFYQNNGNCDSLDHNHCTISSPKVIIGPFY